jgi:hypothetical protein
MRATKLQELEEMAAKLLAIARELPPGPERINILTPGDRKISFANSFSPRRRLAAGTPRAEGEGEMTRGRQR